MRSGSAGGSGGGQGFDITEEASYKELVEFHRREFGGLDGLFNVAADLSARGMAGTAMSCRCPLRCGSTPLSHSTGYMYGIRHALPLLIERGGGAIVNTSSPQCG